MAQQHSNASTLPEQVDERKTAPGALPRQVEHGHDHAHKHSHGFDTLEAARIAFVALSAAAVWFKLWEPLSAVSIIGIAGLAVGCWPILKEAFGNVLERRMTMELSMTIAIAAA